MIKNAQYNLFKLASRFERKLFSFGEIDIRNTDDAIKFLLEPLDGESFVYDETSEELSDPFDFIKSVYRKKSFKVHPDRNPGDLNANEKLKALNKAFKMLREENTFYLKNKLKRYKPKSFTSEESFDSPPAPKPKPRGGRSSLFDPLSEEELAGFESVMGGRRPKDPFSSQPEDKEPKGPFSSQPEDKEKPRPRDQSTRSGLFGVLPKNYRPKF